LGPIPNPQSPKYRIKIIFNKKIIFKNENKFI